MNQTDLLIYGHRYALCQDLFNFIRLEWTRDLVLEVL